MSLYQNLADLLANPPATWAPVKVAERSWDLQDRNGVAFTHATTRKAAAECAHLGFLPQQYDRECRWHAGLPVANYRPCDDPQPAKVLAAAEERYAAAQASDLPSDHPEMVAVVALIDAIQAAHPKLVEDEDDGRQTCGRCGDRVYTLSTAGECDGCVAEQSPDRFDGAQADPAFRCAAADPTVADRELLAFAGRAVVDEDGVRMGDPVEVAALLRGRVEVCRFVDMAFLGDPDEGWDRVTGTVYEPTEPTEPAAARSAVGTRARVSGGLMGGYSDGTVVAVAFCEGTGEDDWAVALDDDGGLVTVKASDAEVLDPED